MNLDFILDECNSRLKEEKVVCVVVYVDDEHANPFRQVIIHGALDVLIDRSHLDETGSLGGRTTSLHTRRWMG
jgi:hypothetical protein